ncbi:hypothetical protein GF415_04460 [Candidatus Micrarchaeota archaeon]|nr:hypothetical protein [Candidatus Micrarchaeota archaeon]
MLVLLGCRAGDSWPFCHYLHQLSGQKEIAQKPSGGLQMNVQEYSNIKRRKIDDCLLSKIPSEPEHIYSMLREFIFRGGKRIRPTLTLACAEAAGGSESDAMDYAVAVELFHNFTLIHDDVEDNSSLRRGKPTINAEYGIPTAVNAGDALYRAMWSAVLSSSDPPDKRLEALRIMVDGFSSVVEAQGTELFWQRNRNFSVSEEEYLRMASGKTGELIGLACKMGAFSADAPEELQLSLQEFGRKIGLAFQIKDDVLNLVSNADKYNKEPGEDIREGKPTLVALKLLFSLPENEKNEVLQILGKHGNSKEEVSRVLFLAKEHGSIDYANTACERLLSEAKSCLSVLSPEKRSLFSGMADYAIRREE